MSTGYLLDTSVLSLLAPGRPDASPEFLAWITQQDRNLFISTVSVMEIEQGIAKLRRQRSTGRADVLTEWLARMLAAFGNNAVPLDTETADLAGRMADQALSIGRPPETADVLIAATALSLECVVLTRNLKHFVPLGVEAIDPLQDLPR